MATTTFTPIADATTSHLTLRSLYHVIGAMITNDIKSTIIELFYLTILDQALGFLYNLDVNS
jgi:hypothetical protein